MTSKLRLVLLASLVCLFLSFNLGIHEVLEKKSEQGSPISSPYLIKINELLKKTNVSASKNDLALLNELIEHNNTWFDENREVNNDSFGEIKNRYIVVTIWYWVLLAIFIIIITALSSIQKRTDFFIMGIVPTLLFIFGFFSGFQFSVAIVSMLAVVFISKFRKNS